RTVTAHEFSVKAKRAIADITGRGKLPIVVGGTGFYIDALLGRLDLPDVAPNPVLRKKLQAKSVPQLFALLKKKDPSRAKSMNTPSGRKNKIRLIRALEVASGKQTEGSPWAQTPFLEGSPRHSVLWVGTAPSQRELERKIQKRLVA